EGVCHICQRSTFLEPFYCGLVKVLSTQRDWAGLVKRFVVATAVSIPLSLIGFRALPNPIPGKTISGELLRLKLMVCSSCIERRRGRFGHVKLKREDWACHPAWGEAHQLGYNRFVPPEELSAWHTPLQ